MQELRKITAREDNGTVQVYPKAVTVVCLSVHSDKLAIVSL